MRFVAILLIGIAAAGCSSVSMHAKQVGALIDPYIGQPVANFVDHFGPPSSDYSSSAVATTYEWSNFSGGQSGMTGCRVLVEAHRTAKQPAADAQLFATYTISPEDYRQWTIDSWSSFGSGCK